MMWEGNELLGIQQVSCSCVTDLHAASAPRHPAENGRQCCRLHGEQRRCTPVIQCVTHGDTFPSSSCSFRIHEEAVCRRQTRIRCRAQAPALLCCIAHVHDGFLCLRSTAKECMLNGVERPADNADILRCSMSMILKSMPKRGMPSGYLSETSAVLSEPLMMLM